MTFRSFFGFYYPKNGHNSLKQGMVEKHAATHNPFCCCHNIIEKPDPANTIRQDKRLKLVSQRRPSKDFSKATARWLFFG